VLDVARGLFANARIAGFAGCHSAFLTMIHHLKQVLTPDELRQLRELAARMPWDDGRKTAGEIAAPHKRNTEAPPQSREAQAAAEIALKALRRHPQFFNAALPAIMSPPMMNRYVEGMEYGDHCDAAILGGSTPMRADISATLFISDPDDYDGGELVTELAPGGYSAKLPAGDLLLYPANTLHHVTKVTRGARIAMIFWTQSMVRDLQQRTLLFDLSRTLGRLERPLAETPEIMQLYACYYNLVRMWATP
jgi:PKHD-type hydroxylase